MFLNGKRILRKYFHICGCMLMFRQKADWVAFCRNIIIVWGMLFAYAAYGMAEAQAVSAKHA